MKPKTTTWRPFSEARAFVHQLGLKSKDKWKQYSKSGERPLDIPSDPEYVYKSEFKGFGDWLGTGTIATSSRSYRPFAEARAFVHTLGLKNYLEWRAYCKSGKKPPDIPAYPGEVDAYRSEFKSLGDWLGTGTVASYKREFRSFSEVRAFVHSLGLKNQDEWLAYCKSGEKPPDIPSNPDRTYWLEFKGYGDWLGTGSVSTQDHSYRPFAEARAFVHTLGLKNYLEWQAYCKSGKKPPDIPSDPGRAYRSEYKGIEDWLGAKYRPFIEARAFVHTLHLKNYDEWEAYRKSGGKPINIPSNPNRVYSAEYKGLRDWLGVVDKWDSRALLARLYELRPQVQTLEKRELYGLLEQEGSLSAFGRILGKRVTPAQVLRELKDNNGSRLEQALRDTLNGEAEAPVGFTVEEASANNSVRAVDVFEQENDGAVGFEMQITNPDKALTTEAHLTASFLHSQGDRAEGSIPQQEEERVTEVVRSTGTVKVFFCYAHEDELLLNKLQTHLRPLQRQGLVDVWHDRDINAGDQWEQDVNEHLNTAEIILLLISPDFMNSDFCYSIEMKRAIERHNRKEAKVIPVILRPVYWRSILGKLQALPKDAKPVMSSSWHSEDEAFFDVAEGIRRLVEKLRENKQTNAVQGELGLSTG